MTFRHRGRVVRAVEDVSYTARAGRTLAIIGESGSGKTVGARAFMGLLPSYAHVEGSARYDGRDLLQLSEREMRSYRGPHLAMIFQSPDRSLNPTMRIGRQIMEAITTHQKISGEEARKRSVDLLDTVRIPSANQRFSDYPHQLSGGMRQRVMIAIALVCNPRILVADEATTALDVTTQAQIMELLEDLQQQMGMALIMISHDMGLAASFSDDVVVMYAGRVVEQGPTSQLFTSVRMPYTRALLDAIPQLDRASHTRLQVVEGSASEASAADSGCSFEPRCLYAEANCKGSRPPLEGNESGHKWACFHPLPLPDPAARSIGGS